VVRIVFTKEQQKLKEEEEKKLQEEISKQKTVETFYRKIRQLRNLFIRVTKK
jgi:hypothetical protein